MSNPLAKTATKTEDLATRKIARVKLLHGVPTLKSPASPRLELDPRICTLEEESRGLGILVDGIYLAPWSTINYVKYE